MDPLVTPDPAPFGAYVLARARQYQPKGKKRPRWSPEPAPQVGLWLRAVLGSAHDLTPAQVARVLRDSPPDAQTACDYQEKAARERVPEVLAAAIDQWEKERGWTHGSLSGCGWECSQDHEDWTSFARCRWPKATKIVDLAGYRSNPEFRVAYWSCGTTVLVTADDSLGGRGDGQLVPGQGSLHRVHVYIAAGVSLDPFGLDALADQYPYKVVAPLLDHLGVSHSCYVHRPEDAAWFRDALDLLASPLPPPEG